MAQENKKNNKNIFARIGKRIAIILASMGITIGSVQVAGALNPAENEKIENTIDTSENDSKNDIISKDTSFKNELRVDLDEEELNRAKEAIEDEGILNTAKQICIDEFNRNHNTDLTIDDIQIQTVTINNGASSVYKDKAANGDEIIRIVDNGHGAGVSKNDYNTINENGMQALPVDKYILEKVNAEDGTYIETAVLYDNEYVRSYWMEDKVTSYKTNDLSNVAKIVAEGTRLCNDSIESKESIEEFAKAVVEYNKNNKTKEQKEETRKRPDEIIVGIEY